MKFSLVALLIVSFSSFVVAPGPNATIDSSNATDNMPEIVTCDAYWEGYIMNAAGECEVVGTSGCNNPFKYKTKEECESGGEGKPEDLDCVPCGNGCITREESTIIDCFEPVEDLKCVSKEGKCVAIKGEFEGEKPKPELFACRDKCKATFSEEEERGKCIRECKSNFEFDHEYTDEELELKGGGTKPDSMWYFVDNFFDQFGDELEVKEEKVAEIKAMIEKGNMKAARKALKKYKKYAEKLETEVNPDQAEEAKRSSLAIEKALREIESQLSEEESEEFYDDIIESEVKITTVAEIASKIKELCQSLSEIDPVEYGRICKTGDDAPGWQKRLDKDLTKEQKEEAIKFGKIMSECFKTSGQDCKCEEIPFPSFADACSVAAPLARACDIDRDEAACDKLDNLEMPELPDHLQDVFEDLEDAGQERYDIHAPEECIEAGIDFDKKGAKEECGRIMIETNAPEECKQALLDSGCKEEWECREICDKIMFELHSPKECIDEGITNPRECGEFMDNFRGQHEGPGGPRIDFNCKEIQDPTARLECFDKASTQATSYQDNYEEIKKQEKECAIECGRQGGRWDFSGGDCKCYFDDNVWDDEGQWHGYDCSVVDCAQGTHCEPDYGCVDDKGKEGPGEGGSVPSCDNMQCGEGQYCAYGECQDYPTTDGGTDGGTDGPSCDDCQSQCDDKEGQRLSGTGCGPNGCECYYESDEPPESDGGGEGGNPPESDGGGEGGTDDEAPDTSPLEGNVFLDYLWN